MGDLPDARREATSARGLGPRGPSPADTHVRHPHSKTVDQASPRAFRNAAAGTGGVALAIGGFIVGSVLALILIEVVAAATQVPVSRGSPVRMTAGITVADEVGLWIGFLGAALLASRLFGTRHLRADLGIQLRLWPDVPLGAAVGYVSIHWLIPLLYLPFQSSHPHLNHQLAHEALTLTNSVHGVGFVIVAVVVVVGSPIMEEIFFRGLLLRALEAWFGVLGRRLAPVAAIVVMGVAFGFAHGEGALLAYGLAVFGLVLGAMARILGRIGPGIVAHAVFNLTSVIAIATVVPR